MPWARLSLPGVGSSSPGRNGAGSCSRRASVPGTVAWCWQVRAPVRVDCVQHITCHFPSNSPGKWASRKGTAFWTACSSSECEGGLLKLLVPVFQNGWWKWCGFSFSLFLGRMGTNASSCKGWKVKRHKTTVCGNVVTSVCRFCLILFYEVFSQTLLMYFSAFEILGAWLKTNKQKAIQTTSHLIKMVPVKCVLS